MLQKELFIDPDDENIPEGEISGYKTDGEDEQDIISFFENDEEDPQELYFNENSR